MSRPGFSFLVCPDPELLRLRVAALLAGAGGAEPWERKTHWGDEELAARFWQDMGSANLMGSRTAVVLRRAEKLKAEDWERFVPALRGFNEGVWPFFCLEGEWDRGKAAIPKVLSKHKFWTVAEKKGWVWQSRGLFGDGMAAFVRTWTQERGLKVRPDALKALCQALPEDAGAAALELSKLELALGPDKTIGPAEVELIAPSGEMDFFEFVGALSKQGATAEVWERVIQNHAESRTMLFQLTSYLASEARAWWMILSGEEGKVRGSPYALKHKAEMARRVGLAGAAAVFDFCMEAELEVKTGSMDEEQVLELLVSRLARLFRPAPVRSR